MRTNHLLRAGVSFFLICVSSSMAVRAEEDRDRGRVLSSEDVWEATGRSIEHWAGAWWQWAFNNPNVLGDTTGQYGALGNVGGPVFFAEGSSGTAVTPVYKVPAGQYILLPVATYVWILFDPCADMVCAAQIIDDNFISHTTGVYAVVDGRPVREMREHLIRVSRRSPFTFLVNAGPVDSTGFGGILPAEEGGYWVMLEPLSPGIHHIDFGATIPNIDGNTGMLLTGTGELTAKLTLVVEAKKHERGF